ncbi:MAG: thioredoxin fold domain-containing protein [Burkholderiales bacterium]|nr:thioredoxin fold domain-containing protein [Burkholderiales bacterium]
MLLIVACSSAVPAAAQLVRADDLAQLAAEGRSKRIPVLIAFMQQSCPYCATSQRDHLIPMQNDPQWRDRVLIREIDVDRDTPLRDFSGAATTHRAFARSLKVRKVPTLIVFDGAGQPVAQPLVGLALEDYYRLYIEQLIEAGQIKMRNPPKQKP